MKNKVMQVTLTIFLCLILISGSIFPSAGQTYAEGLSLVDQVKIALDNLSAVYSTNGPGQDSNSAWVIADMAAYEQSNPDCLNKLSPDDTKSFLDASVSEVSRTTDPAILAKTIISFKSLGYDASNLVNSNGTVIDAVEKLKNSMNDVSVDSISIYILPYILIAIQQDPDYANQAELNLIIEEILDQQLESGGWGYSYDGIDYIDCDAISPVLMALAPYYNSLDNSDIDLRVKAAVDKAIEFISSFQGTSGAIYSNWTGQPNAASTGLMIAGLCAIGKDPSSFKSFSYDGSDVSPAEPGLVEGLLGCLDLVTGDFGSDPFSNEQGLRGLISAANFISNGISFNLYNFADNPSNQYIVNESISDSVYPHASVDNEQFISVYFTLIGDSDHSDDIKHVYADDPSALETWISRHSVNIPLGSSAFDVFDKALKAAGMTYTETSPSYISEVNGLQEFANGPFSGWLYEINGQSATIGCRNLIVSAGDHIVFHYTDDFTRESGSVNWSENSDQDGMIDGSVQVPETTTSSGIITDSIKGFIDVSREDWFYDSVVFVMNHGLFNGTSNKAFSPNMPMSRGMYATVLWRLAGQPAKASPSSHNFMDVKNDQWYTNAVEWTSEKGIMLGYGNGEFGIDDIMTREELATALFRYVNHFNADSSNPNRVVTNAYPPGIKVILSQYKDSHAVSRWAEEAIIWAVSNGLINGRDNMVLAPADYSTRAEVATILWRYMEGPAIDPVDETAILKMILQDIADVIMSSSPDLNTGTTGGEWALLGLERSNLDIPKNYFDKYLQNLEKHIQANKGILSERKYTEYSRVALALTVIGNDPERFAGYNLLAPLGDFEKTTYQGLAGPIWALIALDSNDYSMPMNSTADTQASRKMYIDYLLDRQLDDGGFSLSGSIFDPDTTAMVLYALADYRTNKDIEAAIQEAITCLSENQADDGGYASWGYSTSESVSQVIISLCKLGISNEDPRFIKNDNTLLDNLFKFYMPGKGFLHTQDSNTVSMISTEQALLALVAFQRSEEGLNALFDLNTHNSK